MLSKLLLKILRPTLITLFMLCLSYSYAYSSTDISKYIGFTGPNKVFVDDIIAVKPFVQGSSGGSYVFALVQNSIPQGAIFDLQTGVFTWRPNAVGKTTVVFNAIKNGVVKGAAKLNIDVCERAVPVQQGYVYGSYYNDNVATLNSLQTRTINIDAFNVDINGNPNTAMMLEIRYTDTVNLFLNRNDNRSTHGATLSVKCFDSKNRVESYKSIAMLGMRGMGEQLCFQYLFDKTLFQGLRAVDGKFSIKIKMPNTIRALDSTLTMPIQSVCLRPISAEDAERFKAQQRDMRRFVEVGLGPDEPVIPIIYPDKKIMLYQRDIMHTIYKNTKPSKEEMVLNLSATAFQAETEPLSFAIYSDEGVEGLSFRLEDLRGGAGGIKLSKENIELFEVTYAFKRLQFGNSSEYAFVPDALMPITNRLSVDRASSKRIWIKVHIPEGQYGGVYAGNINLYKDGNRYKAIPISIEVIPMKLDVPNSLYPICADPYYFDMIFQDENAVYDFYSETGVDLSWFIKIDDVAPMKYANEAIADYDINKFKEKFNAMYAKGLFKNNAVVVNIGAIVNVLKKKDGGWLAGYRYIDKAGNEINFSSGPEADLWYKLSSEAFVKSFKRLIEILISIGAEKGVLFRFNTTDEPGILPDRRIVADRTFAIIHSLGGKTTTTYYLTCDDAISSGSYSTPTGKIPSLKDFVDYKVSTLKELGMQKNQQYNYYTTNVSHLRNPIYNRFLTGFMAVKQRAEQVNIYAMGDMVGDPFNDFDGGYNYIFALTQPDYLTAYPTWDGKVIPAMHSEGLREGIKDAKYIATLKRLIKERGGNVAADADAYLARLVSRIGSNFWNDYVNNSPPAGFTDSIVSQLSEKKENKAKDFQAFSEIRNEIIKYIKALKWPTISMTPEQLEAIPDLTNQKQLVVDCLRDGVSAKGVIDLVEGENVNPVVSLIEPSNDQLASYASFQDKGMLELSRTLNIDSSGLLDQSQGAKVSPSFAILKTITLDSVPPDIVINSNIPALTNKNMLTVRYTCDGLAKTEKFVLKDGINKDLVIVKTDRAGNVAFKKLPVVELDTIPPVLIITSNIPLITGERVLNVEYTCDGELKTATFNLKKGLNDDLVLIDTDPAGNVARKDLPPIRRYKLWPF
ncbi:MAG: hypothetical protein HZC15_04885 [Candidatus Omnitrophica bacterium]|nr:hypothetical protein [Candidatus Omnitrophota bacterium]